MIISTMFSISYFYRHSILFPDEFTIKLSKASHFYQNKGRKILFSNLPPFIIIYILFICYMLYTYGLAAPITVPLLPIGLTDTP